MWRKHSLVNANRGFLDLSELGDFASAAIENDTVSFIAAYGDGRVFTCNQSFSRLTGYTKGEISAMRWPEDFTPPEQRHQMELLIDSVACDVAPCKYEKALIRKDGSRLIGNVRKLQKETWREAKPLVVDVTTVISEAKRRFEAGIDRDVAIRYTPHSSCRVMANELLADVFGNIVGNAIKHSEGQVSIVIEQRTVREDGRDYCRVAIEDDGPGIPDEQKRKVFARDNKEKARLTGKGLGLHLVRTLVDDYRGKIWVEDRVPGDHSRGCRFVIMLPLVQPVG
jgi:PAS domain S-box-containing protein